MRNAQLVLHSLNVLLFVTVAARAFMEMRKERSRYFRSMLRIAVVLSVVLVFGSLRASALVLAQDGVIPQRIEAVAQATLLPLIAVALATMVVAVRAIRQCGAMVSKAERVLLAVSDDAGLNVAISEMGLTAREYDVLHMMSAGRLTNGEIAEGLYLSPATAGNYVSGILQKTGLKDRKELLLIEGFMTGATIGGGTQEGRTGSR